jgi:hypothetical protein
MLQAEVQQLRAEREAERVEREAERAEREAERAEREAERQRTQALEARHEGFLKFMQQLGEQQGWEIPAQLLAPPPPPPPHHRESTPVSMSTKLSIKHSVSLRLELFMCEPKAGFIHVLAFVPEMWSSAFVQTFLLQVLETSPCRGGAAEISNFSLNYLHLYLATHTQSALFFCSINRGRRRTMSKGRRHRTSGHPHLDRRRDRTLGHPYPRRHRTLDHRHELPSESFSVLN